MFSSKSFSLLSPDRVWDKVTEGSRPLFLHKFLSSMRCSVSRGLRLRKTSSIRPAVLTQYRLVTDRDRAVPHSCARGASRGKNDARTLSSLKAAAFVELAVNHVVAAGDFSEPRCRQRFTHTHTHTQPFNGLLSATTRVGRYQKKHSPTHTHPDHRTSFIDFLHLLRSITSSVFSLCA